MLENKIIKLYMAQDSGDGAKRSAEIKRTKTENVPGRKEVL